MQRRAFPFPLAPEVPLYLAPMAGVSESPFRRLCRAHGADVVVTEFLSAEGIRRENEATISKLRFESSERPIGVQIFGADPQAMGEAAAFVTDVFQPEFIDINFGCPVKKVVKRNGGSGCLKDLGLVEDVIRAVSRSTSLPVTVKIRSGWSEEMRDPVTIALRCQDAGARVLTLHPRTRAQMYSGSARWEEIAAVTQALEIPVLGNGDIKTADDAVRMYRETGCTGVMIARGSFGQPWIFAQVRAMLEGTPVPADPTVEERFAIALQHAHMADAYEPDRRGAAIEFRKHLGWYAKGLPGSAELRKKLHAVTSLGEVEGIFADYLAHRERYAEAQHEPGRDLEVAEA
ncbi:MAG: tRNA dihydrouridine synthase DusB [Gemmatimonadaceae bacterium]|nr:tRNA dihydrouridine synthase DusB [Gemmatimonadaceae bacterium]NUQ92070.1 tRNA dihydrouridine synthase DusB [Gemmatimonadaceae bacterium]NUR20079.1 tRNA dihydrouridine synthase DusB [Gemmatimonadaceae bacterium]NUS96513.1 tRNA dihydrouridine synthase DusB [Gemmatimonadaceae bacterium]